MTPVPPPKLCPSPGPSRVASPSLVIVSWRSSRGPFQALWGSCSLVRGDFKAACCLIPELPQVDNGLKASQFSFPSPALCTVLGPQLADLKRV